MPPTPPPPPRSQHPSPQLNPTVYLRIRVCPECAGPVAHNSGCVTCRACGWGRCG